MYAHYQTRKKPDRRASLLRLLLALAFLVTLGFAGGVLYLLFFLVPFEQQLVNRGLSQNAVDAVLTVLVIGWVLFGLVVTFVYGRLFLRRRGLLPAVGVAGASLAAACVVFFFLLDNDFMAAAGQLGQQSAQEGQRIAYGPYPDTNQLEELKDEGYDGVITLLSPSIPFERVLLEEEFRNGEDAGIPVYSRPMLPWISGNEDSLEGIKRLATRKDQQFYVHCYLGKHRVDLVRQELSSSEDETAERVPLPDRFERGRVASFGGERVILGPYPTDDEWFEYVLRRDVEEIVSTLNPNNPEDRSWIENERRVARENGVEFTLMPLDPARPDPAAVREVSDYVASSERKIYVHDFLDAERFEALQTDLNRRMPAAR